ncbi:histone H1C-like [Vespa crabro]|uniref:histone H1C-like n=1 Tax=Vespa crabro TaxID=7445 RepID=UPI001F02C865|nr:histone H1C-like [Vespa crabro]
MNFDKGHIRHCMLFCFNQKKTVEEAKRIISATYGENVVSTNICKAWFKRFKSGELDFHEKPRLKISKKFKKNEFRKVSDINPPEKLEKFANGFKGENESIVSPWLKPIGFVVPTANIQRSKSNHPSISKMVTTAIEELKDRKGSSLQAIKKYIIAKYDVNDEKLTPFIKKYLKTAVSTGTIIQTTGKGDLGYFKLSIMKSRYPKTKIHPVIKKKKTANKSIKKRIVVTRKIAVDTNKKSKVLTKKAESTKKFTDQKKPKVLNSKAGAVAAAGVTKTKITKKAPQQKFKIKKIKIIRVPIIRMKAPKSKRTKK